MEYALHIMILFLIYSILAVSLDLLIGHTGLLSIAHGAFFGLGAYASALVAVDLSGPYLLGVLCAMVVAALMSLLISLPTVRLRGDYLAIATYAFQMILYSMLNNWVSVTGGPSGIPGINRPTILGWLVDTNWEFAALAVVFALVAYAVVWRITASPLGRILRCIREDEVFGRGLGKNVLRCKVTVFAVSAALAAMAGSLYAHYFSYIDPTSFTVMESILVIAMVIIGGAGSLWGPLIGAFVLVMLPEGLRFLGLPSAVAANLRQIIYGSLLVVMMMVRPRGLGGRYAFGR